MNHPNNFVIVLSLKGKFINHKMNAYVPSQVVFNSKVPSIGRPTFFLIISFFSFFFYSHGSRESPHCPLEDTGSGNGNHSVHLRTRIVELGGALVGKTSVTLSNIYTCNCALVTSPSFFLFFFDK